MKKHAMLSASGASRWLTCSPSARLEAELYTGTGYAVSSVYADEGTLAHYLGEWLIRHKAWGVNIDAKLQEVMDNPLYTEEMMDVCQEYANFVVDVARNAPEGSTLIQEQRLNLVEFIPEGFGTVDNCIVGGNEMHIIDLKYGKGVAVDSYENPQLMVYGLGALMEYDTLYNIRNVKLTIYQPRIGNTSTYEITAQNLIRWGYEVLRPGAQRAFEGIGEFIPGDHCKFCKVRSTCKANAAYNLKVAAREFNPVELSDEQVVKALERAPAIISWLNALKEHALHEALKGKKWPGMKLVAGRSTRKYTDEQKILDMLIKAGADGEQLVNKKLIGISKLSKLLPKLQFELYVEPFLYKPPGSPTLVSEDDKRPELDRNSAATTEFEIIPDEDE